MTKTFQVKTVNPLTCSIKYLVNTAPKFSEEALQLIPTSVTTLYLEYFVDYMMYFECEGIHSYLPPRLRVLKWDADDTFTFFNWWPYDFKKK